MLLGGLYNKLMRFRVAVHSLVLGGSNSGPVITASGANVKVPGLVVGTTTFSEAEFGVLDGLTPGTVAASKAVVVDANKDAAAFRNVTATNFDAGASGTAGSVDIFPATASKGKATYDVTDQTGNTTVTHRTAAMGQATVITTPDPGAAAASVVLTEGAQTINGAKTIPDLNVGASGTAGAFDIFPATAAKGKATYDVTDQTGNTTVTHRTAAMGQATVITTPDPGAATASVVLTEGAQTINGVKTFGNIPVLPAGGLTAGTTTLTEAELAKLDGISATAYLPVVCLRSFTETTGAGTYTANITIPPNALLIDVKVWSTVLWDTLTSATMIVGDLGDPDGWFTGIDLKATDLLVGEELNFVQTGGKQGAYLDTTTGKRTNAYFAAGTTLSGVVTTVGATGSAGRTFLAVIYVVLTATAATKA